MRTHSEEYLPLKKSMVSIILLLLSRYTGAIRFMMLFRWRHIKSGIAVKEAARLQVETRSAYQRLKMRE